MKTKVLLAMVLLSVSFLNLNFGQNVKTKTFKIWVDMANSDLDWLVQQQDLL